MATEPVVASQNATVLDPNLGIHRKVVAGQPVPPELVEAYQQTTGDTTAGPAEPGAGKIDYNSWPADDVEAEVERLGLEVVGTGANGNVTKADRVKALEASGRPE
jgi:hypothetical protein